MTQVGYVGSVPTPDSLQSNVNAIPVGAGVRPPVAVMVPIESTNVIPSLSSQTPVPLQVSMNQLFMDVVIPANVGDNLQYILSGNAAANAASGLIFSVWSIGGTAFREWNTGTVGAAVSAIASAKALYSLAAGVGSSFGRFTAKCTNKVIASDIDPAGMVTLRLYIANAAAGGPFTHNWFSFSPSGHGAAIGINWRQAAPKPSVYAYPGVTMTGAGLINTSGTAGVTMNPVTDSTGQIPFDVNLSARVGDVIVYDCALAMPGSAVCTPVLSAWTVGGSLSRNIEVKSTAAVPTAGNKDLGAYNNGGAFFMRQTAYFRVLDTDLDPNGICRIRMYATDNSHSQAINTKAINPNDGAGNISYAAATLIPAEFTTLITAVGGLSTGAPQEGQIWQDPSGVWNILFKDTVNGVLGAWLAQSNLVAGPYIRKGSSPVIGQPFYGGQISRYLENGITYLYYRDQSSGSLFCQFGPSLSQLGAPVSVLSPQKSTFNSKVVRGPGGVYYLFADDAGFNTYVATGPTPVGPFTLVQDPVTLVNGTALTWIGSAEVEWTGGYFRMFCHAGIGGQNSPTYIFVLTSNDGITWTFMNYNLAGTPTPIWKNYQEWNWGQVADARVVRDQAGNVYIMYDINQNLTPAFLALSNPLQMPVPL